jgi:hypothetical protein
MIPRGHIYTAPFGRNWRIDIQIPVLISSSSEQATSSSFSFRASTYHINMCIVNYNLYACKHKIVLNTERCPENIQGLPCNNVWKEVGYRLGECMSCVMEEPAGQGKSSSDPATERSELDSGFFARAHERESRFHTLAGCRWYSGFPKSKQGHPWNCIYER